MSVLLYRRVVTPGGRVQYVEAGVHSYDVYPKGAHLVVVSDGWTRTTYHVDPDHAALLAALPEARDAMCRAILDAASASGSGARDVVEVGLAVLVREAAKRPMVPDREGWWWRRKFDNPAPQWVPQHAIPDGVIDDGQWMGECLLPSAVQP